MVLDGNYQNAFRPQYARRVDIETGKIIEGLSECL